jgi:hypothetical protein
MTPTDRAAAVVSRLIAANLIAAPFEDVPDGTYYPSIVATIADAIREDRAATVDSLLLLLQASGWKPPQYWDKVATLGAMLETAE